ncbi:MAG: hypothetical protein A3I04_01615 [Nitrospinae bacterium RIFCSPLOWO2_02_FULL_39_110]|nr:MAG: hypothetical protein A2W53_04735 [Nitrospinae bacterium RIFCSPHIGHO2_02_39_11]OGW04043.1 MAG: hypothetical protein A3I04_01615 [Nitrospinae bacterium RIFCSPLOWO2_02_FULL_39_110]OGW08396.1 MAG: hypothetical protein A2W75_03215 [Nitrospinae bacterium RIFCSPLOWO2_12_39_15]
MLPKGVLSKIGGVLSLISLLFLPLVRGCQVSVTGFDVLKTGGVGPGIKLMLIISIVCAIVVFFLKTAIPFFITGGGGIGGLLGAYTIARQEIPLEIEIGTILSIIGFGLVLAEGFLLQSQKGEGGGQDTHNSKGGI